MKNPRITTSLEFQLLEDRRLLSVGNELLPRADTLSQSDQGLSQFVATTATWVDAAGNVIGNNDVPNRTDIFARLTTDATLPETIVASVYEDDLFGDDFIVDIELNRTSGNTWIGPWRALWSDDGIGVPEYYFRTTVNSNNVNSNLVTVLQGNAWHAQASASGSLAVGSSVEVSFSPSELPAGLNLAQVAIEIDFGSVAFSNAPHEFEVIVRGPHAPWNGAISIPVKFDFQQPIVQVFRTGGCDVACPGNDFTTAFMDLGLTQGFYGNWSISATNLEPGDLVGVDSFRSTLTFFSRLNTSGYDPNAAPDQNYSLDSQRENGFLSDFANNELTNPLDVTNAVVFVHGWNPGGTGTGDNFQTVYSAFWDSLEPTIQSLVDSTSNWLVAEYDWVNDAATGSNDTINVPLSLARSPLSSRDVGTAHGPFLGRAIQGLSESLFPNLESVQFIAFSSGNWVGMEAAAYLRDIGFEGAMQLTSLDPFVTDRQTVFGVPVGVETERIFEASQDSFAQDGDIIENYWVDDESDALLGWTSGDYAGWDVNRQLDEAQNEAPLFSPKFDFHNGPIGWYAETAAYLLNQGDITQLLENGFALGFGSSLLYEDWLLATAETVNVDSFNTLRGSPIGGGLLELQHSDNTYLRVRQEGSGSPTVQLEITGVAPSAVPDLLGFRLEASINSISLLQSIEAFNFFTGQYEAIDIRDATLQDSVVEFEFSSNPADFVQAGTGEVRARLTWKDNGSNSLLPWVVKVDQAVWLIRYTNPPNGFQQSISPPIVSGTTEQQTSFSSHSHSVEKANHRMRLSGSVDLAVALLDDDFWLW